MKAIEDRYKRALIEEHKNYVRTGRTAQAKQVAEVLRTQYGHEVDASARSETKTKEPAAQTAAEPRLPEAAVAPKPEPASPETKPAVKKAPAKRTLAKPASEGK